MASGRPAIGSSVLCGEVAVVLLKSVSIWCQKNPLNNSDNLFKVFGADLPDVKYSKPPRPPSVAMLRVVKLLPSFTVRLWSQRHPVNDAQNLLKRGMWMRLVYLVSGRVHR